MGPEWKKKWLISSKRRKEKKRRDILFSSYSKLLNSVSWKHRSQKFLSKENLFQTRTYMDTHTLSNPRSYTGQKYLALNHSGNRQSRQEFVSSLAQVGDDINEAHQEQAPHAHHHKQEEQQDGHHRLHHLVAKVPSGETHVHQLLIDVWKRWTFPGPCILPLLLLLLVVLWRVRAGVGGCVEKALLSKHKKVKKHKELSFKKRCPYFKKLQMIPS